MNVNGAEKKRALRGKRVSILAAAVIAVILALGSWLGLWKNDAPAPQPETRVTAESGTDAAQTPTEAQALKYVFYNEKTMNEHFRKHRDDTGCATVEEYLARANAVIDDPDSLHKFEAEDGDDVYYLEATNEIVFVSPRGYIRTYFCPDSGKAYFDKQ